MEKKPTVFVREATGLVRDVSVIDSFGVGITGVGIIAIYLFYSQFMLAAPGDNPFLSIGIMAVPFLALAAVWALLATAFPRSGGDYVFNTRSIHPAVGFMTDFLYVSVLPSVFPIFVIIMLGLFSDLFSIEGFLMNSPGLTSLSAVLATPNVEFGISTILTVVTLLLLIGRTKIYVRMQSIIVVLAIITVLSLVLATGLTPSSAYPALFNHFFKSSYSSIVKSAGLSAPAFAGASLFGTSFLIYWLAGPQWAAFMGGETKRTNRAFLYSIVGGQLVMIILFLIVGLVSFNTFGTDFSYATNYLASQGKLSIAATQGTFLDLTAPIIGNPLLIAVVYVIIALQAFLVGSMSLMGTTRKVFAWSFDRLLPSKFSEVSPRFRTPIPSAILVAAIAEIFAVILIYGPGIFTIISGVGVIFSGIIWGVGALSGIFIVARKEVFQSAPELVKRKVAGIPLVGLLGFFSFVTIIGVLVVGQLIPTLQGGLDPDQAIWTFGIFFGGLVYYYIVKAYRRSQGVDLSLVYGQIPPE